MQRRTREWVVLALSLTLAAAGCGRGGGEGKAAGESGMQEQPAQAQEDTGGAMGGMSQDTAAAESGRAMMPDTAAAESAQEMTADTAASMQPRNLFVVLFRQPVTDDDVQWLKNLGFTVEKKTGDSELQVSLPQGTPLPQGVRDAPRVLRFQQVMR